MSYKVNFWFKNLMSYRLTKPLDWDLNELQRQLSDCEFHPCGSQDQSKFGWTNPLKGSELLHFSVGKHILLVAKKEEKMLPANVVKRELDECIESLEQKENRKLKKNGKTNVKR